jgi:uncharacterized protein
MLHVDSLTLLVVVVSFGATLLRSALGFGEALIAVPLLAFVLPVKVAALIAVLVSITVAAVVVPQDWRHVHVRSTARLVLSTPRSGLVQFQRIHRGHELVVAVGLATAGR